MRTLCCLALVLVACDGDSLAPGGECTAPICATATKLCTNDACATSPCTPGCVFDRPIGDDCPSNRVSVTPAEVTSCAHFCGFALPVGGAASDATAAGNCYHYDANAVGCADVPACVGYNAACWIQTYSFGANEAVICGADDTCYDGSYVVEDMAQRNSCGDLASDECPTDAPASGEACANVPSLCSYTAPNGQDLQCACESGLWMCGEAQRDMSVPLDFSHAD